ncbi:MAG: Transcriptional regulator BlaI [Firmicutes bacterium]|nr:Transcriptional regulator BlaI [candidate division NPL-UPA2 bacterium]MBT9154521.1 Transcriptional regulator BlaI [candidate division NPL-UPA2 bacterium]MBT9156579.1 Transcriptional regulator BlaI [candidate division NPL-UPA2 bacterium]
MEGKAIVPEFRPQKAGLKQILGDLEADIMELVWARGQCTVRDVYEALLVSRERELAYTTIMTVMSRLAEKAVLLREAAGNTYVYMPALGREEYLARVVGEVLDALFVSHREQTISHLASRLKAVDASELDRLEVALAKRKEHG